jgi:hypothetical protein
MALLAIIDPLRHALVAHLAFMVSAKTSEAGVLAIMTSGQLFCHFKNSMQNWRLCSPSASVLCIDGFGCTTHEAVFIPLRALAGLPGCSLAEIAKMDSAKTPAGLAKENTKGKGLLTSCDSNLTSAQPFCGNLGSSASLLVRPIPSTTCYSRHLGILPHEPRSCKSCMSGFHTSCT